MLNPFLFIDVTPNKGRGIFTNKQLEAGIVIEVAPVIVMTKTDREHLDKTLLHDYIFEWGTLKDKCCMALGLVPIYNHSFTSNCEYFMDFDKEIISIKTVRPIKKGDEITINYNGDWNDAAKLWFDAAR